MNEITIYTDGGCSGNPGPGGWAYVLIMNGKEILQSGADPKTTNNRMELTAVIRSLEKAGSIFSGQEKDGAAIRLYTDSQYVKNGITDWIKKWEKNGWKTASKAPVKNQELWKTLRALSLTLPISWEWVKGHAGNHYNEQCDQMVQEAMFTIK